MTFLNQTLFLFFVLAFVELISGKGINTKDHPYAATIVGTTDQPLSSDCICGGTILNLFWILSAGSCAFSPTKIEWPPAKISTIPGTLHCYQLEGNYQKIPIMKSVVHPEYTFNDDDNVTHIYNDIALFLLKTGIDFSIGDVRPVKLATPQWLAGKLPEEVVKSCSTFGWAAKNFEEKTIPNDIYDVDLPLFSTQDCFWHFQEPGLKNVKFDRDRVVCTMFLENRDMCYGDAGNPLMCDGYQVGIVSGKEHCGVPGVPSVWTRIDYYNNWIRRTVKVIQKKMISQSRRVKGSFLVAVLVAFIS